MDYYPLKFETIFKEKIWGGTKIRDVLGKDFSPLDNCGETWELSGVPGNISVVKNGKLKGKHLNELIALNPDSLLGPEIAKKYNSEFPLLIKFIDANADLSVQVHPDNQLAEKRHDCKGKTEMWYIMQADEEASLIAGFSKKVSQEEYLEHLENGKLYDILNEEKVDKGDVFYIPAGRVHTIGKGILLAEIQQTSDVTYRIYDFDRTDKEGNKRQLHTEEALDALDYNVYDEYKTLYEEQQDSLSNIVDSEYFVTSKLNLTGDFQHNLSSRNSFTILIVLSGSLVCSGDGFKEEFAMGDVILIPFSVKNIVLKPEGEAQMLDVTVP